MTSVYDDWKKYTLYSSRSKPNVVTQVKTADTDGYYALQLGTDRLKRKIPLKLCVDTLQSSVSPKANSWSLEI